MPTFDAYIDPATGDLPAVPQWVTGPTLAVQRARIRLGTFYGEWILDRFKGLPFYSWREQKPPDLAAQASILIAELQDTPGVIRVVSVESSFDVTTREARHEGVVLVEGDSEGDEAAYAFAIAVGANTTPAVTAFYPIRAIAVSPGVSII